MFCSKVLMCKKPLGSYRLKAKPILASNATAVPFSDPKVNWLSLTTSELFNSISLRHRVAASRLAVANGSVLENCSGEDQEVCVGECSSSSAGD